MIKVFIVDDEYYSRKGLKCIIPWEKMNCEVCGEASNAYEAIDLANELKPDIIVTDINMPEVNGIEMAKKIKILLPNVKFIVISGYDDFQYARGAIKINALDFILKPIKVKEFTEAIMNAVNLIKKEKDTNTIYSEKELLRIMRGQSEIENVNKYFYGISKIRVILINNDSYEYFIKENKEKLNIRISSIIKTWISENINDAYIFDAHSNRIGLIMKDDVNGNFSELINKILEEVEGIITIAITNSGEPIKLKCIYRKAKDLFERCFYKGYGKILNEEKEDSFIVSYHILEELANEIVDNVVNCHRKLCEENINKLFDKFSISITKKVTINKIVVELILKIKQKLNELEISTTSLEAIEIKNDYKLMIDLKYDLETVITLAIEKIREYNGILEDSSIKRAIRFINNNYNKNISLGIVASSVYLNESYLCRELKQSLGVGFLEYIRKLRIEKAIELLRRGHSVATVAVEIGYSDYRQFSYNFKKYTGNIPSNYKKEIY
ncbi:hypothetical protein DIC82_12715 [Clostridium beijerinckii]|nr:hypothetical protein DIC82_12715 [Clostridium beijerinckii]